MTSDSICYSLYDLQVTSTLNLPELPVIDSERVSPDVHIREGTVDPVTEGNDSARGRQIHAAPNSWRLTYEGIGSVRVTDGDTVVYDVVEPDVTEMKALRRVIMNHAFAVVLLQRGLLVLHASAVSIGGQAVVFLGSRTSGKSTTAAAFREHGYQVLGDDVIGVRFDTEIPHVVPGVPEIRLAPDAVTELGISNAVEPIGDGGPERLYCSLSADRSPKPLAKCYYIQESESVDISPLSAKKSFFTLTAGTYAQGLLSDVDRTDEHFTQCATAVDAAEVSLLQRPKQFGELSTVVRAVVSDTETDG